MRMTKKVKCKCRRCGKVFVTTKADKIMTEYCFATVCKDCENSFNEYLIGK